MTTRLSDILERLRPAGTPGAPSEGTQQREADHRQHETAAVATRLLAFEKEADAIVENARQRAEQIHTQAQTRVRQIDDELSDRVAIAGTSASQASSAHTATEHQRILAQAKIDVDGIQQGVEAKIAEVTLAATALVWASVSAPPTVQESP
jgi:vacuolar-type H+-ATPase subunit H